MTYKNDRMPNEHECKCGVENEVVLQNVCMNCLSIRIMAEIERCNPDLSKDLQEKKYFRVFRIIEGKQT